MRALGQIEWVDMARIRAADASARLDEVRRSGRTTRAELLHIKDQLETAAAHLADAMLAEDRLLECAGEA
jgi:hypothetical protein